MKIYVMRHGQTVWNAIGRVQGWSANHLSKLGKQQVKESSERLRNEKIDVIFSSPLMRTMQTANIMNLPHKVKIIKDDRLIEKKQGCFTGRFKNTITEEEHKLRLENPACFGAETWEEIYDRTKDFLSFIKENFSDKVVLIVTHRISADFCEMILNGEKLNKEKYKKSKDNFKNAEIRKFEI